MPTQTGLVLNQIQKFKWKDGMTCTILPVSPLTQLLFHLFHNLISYFYFPQVLVGKEGVKKVEKVITWLNGIYILHYYVGTWNWCPLWDRCPDSGSSFMQQFGGFIGGSLWELPITLLFEKATHFLLTAC